MKKSDGVFFPQNKEYVKTSEMVKIISEVHGKRIILTRLFNPIIRLLKFKIVRKVFGSLTYEKSLSYDISDINFIDFQKSIKLTEE